MPDNSKSVVKGLNIKHFAKQFTRSAEDAIFSLEEISYHAGIVNPAALEPQEVDAVIAFDLIFEAMCRELIDPIEEYARPSSHVIILTNGVLAHPPEIARGFFADLGTLKKRLHDYGQRIHFATFDEGSLLAMQRALVNEAFRRKVPVIFAQAGLTKHDHAGIARMCSRGHGYVKAETMDEATSLSLAPVFEPYIR
ncbi:MAG: hypothetical protein WBK55_06715 [Alphaproteobacteria bacterium]